MLEISKSVLMFINSDIPPIKCKLRKEFLYALQEHEGEFVDCTVFAVSSHEKQSLLFFAFIEGGAIWECLPLHAFVCKEDAPRWSLEHHQPYDCLSSHVGVIVFDYLKHLHVSVRTNNGWHDGVYLFSVDWTHFPDEDAYKGKNTMHVIKLENGLIVAQPNNKILWNHPEHTLDNSKRDYKPLSESWCCKPLITKSDKNKPAILG